MNRDTDNSNRTIGKKIAKLRAAKGLTQLQLAVMSGVDRTYLARIERGKANPSLKIIVALMLKLDVTLDELL